MAQSNDSKEPCGVQCTDTDDLPVPTFEFTPINDVSNVEKDATCDVLAVVKEVGELGSITSKATQKPVSQARRN